jgi:hypothetical protein
MNNAERIRRLQERIAALEQGGGREWAREARAAETVILRAKLLAPIGRGGSALAEISQRAYRPEIPGAAYWQEDTGIVKRVDEPRILHADKPDLPVDTVVWLAPEWGRLWIVRADVPKDPCEYPPFGAIARPYDAAFTLAATVKAPGNAFCDNVALAAPFALPYHRSFPPEDDPAGCLVLLYASRMVAVIENGPWAQGIIAALTLWPESAELNPRLGFSPRGPAPAGYGTMRLTYELQEGVWIKTAGGVDCWDLTVTRADA